MDRHPSRRLTAWFGGTALAVAILGGLVLSSTGVDGGGWGAVAGLVVQTAFGLVAVILWTDRAHRVTGVLLAAASVCMGLGSLDSDVFWARGGYWGEIGWLLTWYQIPLIALVLLRYPVPAPRFRGRSLLIIGLFVVYLIRIPASFFWSPAEAAYTGPGRWLTLFPAHDVTTVLLGVADVLLAVLTVWFAVVQIRRWRTAAGPARLEVRMTAAVAVLLAAVLLARVLLGLVSLIRGGGPGLEGPIGIAHSVAGASAAVLLLVLALRRAVRRSDVIGRMLSAAGDPQAVEETLRTALGDPTLSVSYCVAGQWVDALGSPAPGRRSGGGRTTYDLADRDGTPTARVDADASVASDPAQLHIALAAAALALENTRLAVERTAHLTALAAARSRIVEAGVLERRKLERDLHDGAQQSLLGVTATLSRAGLAGDVGQMRTVVEEARGQLVSALAELRQLARGIHPAALAQGGLALGLSSLAARTDRVELSIAPALEGVRLPTVIESTAYFVVAEAVANAIKYAGPGPIAVHVERTAEELIVVISDRGPGTARLVPAGGLTGLRDRVHALGGSFVLKSAAGEGTRVEARLPLTGFASDGGGPQNDPGVAAR